MRRIVLRASALLFCVIPSASAWGQVTIPDEYGRHIQQRSELASMEGQFGERIDLNSGSLEIIQTDIDLPGNDALAVRVGRRFRPSDVYGNSHFNHWDMDIPHLHGTFANVTGWAVEGANPYKRCSQFSAPPLVSIQGGFFDPDEYWSGSFLYLPGGGEQELLQRGNAHVPSDGHVYPAVTKAGAAVRCVTLAATSQSGSQGEGFEAVTPDGVVYTFNHMVTRNEKTLQKASPEPMLLASDQQNASGAGQALVPVNYILPRMEVLLFPTQVKDRFGNVVTYVWSATNPWQLVRIAASDGRQLDFTYYSGSDRVATVSAGSRTWRYAYAAYPGPSDEADTLTLPDLSVWSYRLGRLAYAAVRSYNVTCDNLNPSTPSYAGSITSPSGAKLELTMASVKLGRSWAFRECIHALGDSEYAREPYQFVGLAVTSKKLTGAGLPTAGLSWGYSYGAPNHCWHPASVPAGNYPGMVACTAASPTTRVVSVTNPDGTVTRHTFGNRYRVDEGLTLTVEHGWNGTSAMRSTAIAYADPASVPYAAFNGHSVRNNGDYDITSRVRPQRQVTTTQEGMTFVWQVAADCVGMPYCFDDFARPAKVVKSSAPAP